MASTVEEKRNFPRIKIRTPISCQIKNTHEFNNTVCGDISLGGVGFINNKFIAPQTPVELEINILSRILRPRGRTIWATHLSHSDRYRSGIEFLALDLQEKNYLKDFIDMQMGKL